MNIYAFDVDETLECSLSTPSPVTIMMLSELKKEGHIHPALVLIDWFEPRLCDKVYITDLFNPVFSSSSPFATRKNKKRKPVDPQALVKSVASSTAIETGNSVAEEERRLTGGGAMNRLLRRLKFELLMWWYMVLELVGKRKKDVGNNVKQHADRSDGYR